MKRTGSGRFNLHTELRLRSGLEMHREMEMPSDIEGKIVIMSGQASYQDGMVTRANWKPGYLFLTEDRLIFMQGPNMIFDLLLNSLYNISIVKRNWVPNKKVEQLRLIQKSDALRKVFYLFARNLGEWEKRVLPQVRPSLP